MLCFCECFLNLQHEKSYNDDGINHASKTSFSGCRLHCQL